MPSKDLHERRQEVLARVLDHVERRGRLLVLKAPPGSGKTFVTLRAVALARHLGQRVAVAVQTNNQAHDLCRRFAREFPSIGIVRFASVDLEVEDLGSSVLWLNTVKQLPRAATIVVATTAKWATTEVKASFDIVFIDEAWQLCWADFMILGQVAPRFVLVGDPGQISPVVRINVARWETTQRPPHRPAPKVLLEDDTLDAQSLELPITTRLPHDTTSLIQPFYDFPFQSWAKAGDRRLTLESRSSHSTDPFLDLLTTGSVSLLKVPTPDSGPPLEDDRALARKAGDIVRRLLQRKAHYQSEDDEQARPLTPKDIGLAATHRIMVSRLQEALGPLASNIRVDTAERWQGLERPFMLCLHPLSGNLSPTHFDLSTGRLCVLGSRHRVALAILSRDHVGETLRHTQPRAEQAVGVDDESGQGHARNLALWTQLEELGRCWNEDCRLDGSTQ